MKKERCRTTFIYVPLEINDDYLWLFSSQLESSKRMIAAHVCIRDPQACSPAKRKGHQCTKETQKISQAQLRAHRANPQHQPAKEYLVMPESSTPEAPCQAQNTHYALHTLAPNPHANPQARGPPTKTPRPQPSSHPDQYVCFCHSWCMNSIGLEDAYQVIQNLQYLS